MHIVFFIIYIIEKISHFHQLKNLWDITFQFG